jgi:hypothetical protein
MTSYFVIYYEKHTHTVKSDQDAYFAKQALAGAIPRYADLCSSGVAWIGDAANNSPLSNARVEIRRIPLQ